MRGIVNIHESHDEHTTAYTGEISERNDTFPTVANVTQFVNQQTSKAAFPLPANHDCFHDEWIRLFKPHIVNVSVGETCATIMKAVNHAANVNIYQSDEAEMQLITSIDACLYIFNIILRRNHKRNISTTTSGLSRPDYSNECQGKYPLIVGEDKLDGNYTVGIMGKDPKMELISKSPLEGWTVAYGEIPYIFGYYAIGDATTNRICFGLIHPGGDNFTTLFEGDITHNYHRARFVLCLIKLIPVLLYLMRVAQSQSVSGLGWKRESMERGGARKALSLGVINKAIVLEIRWECHIQMNLLIAKVEALRPAYDILCRREDPNVLHYHPDHTEIEEIFDHRTHSVVGYKCFLLPFGKPVGFRDILELKQCLLTICREVQWCHQHNVILNDIRWTNICTTDDGNSFFLVDFDDARVVEGPNFRCPSNPDLDAKTHFGVEKEHSFEVDIWAIGILIDTASTVGITLSIQQRNVGRNIMTSVEKGDANMTLDRVIALIETFP